MQSDTTPDATRVAIIGGGCAAIATAIELSDPDNPAPFDITIYQMGWRLGGKGASGRGLNDRIEEHGLHLWLGFYENAFGLMRKCYQELDRNPSECPITTIDQAFVRDSGVALAERTGDDTWQIWSALFPESNAFPGDPFDKENPFALSHYVLRSIDLVIALLKSADVHPAQIDAHSESNLLERLSTLLRYGQVAGSALALEVISIIQAVLRFTPTNVTNPLLEQALETIQQFAQNTLTTLVSENTNMRRVWTIVDLVLAILRGIYRYGLLTHPRGFDAINDYDWLEWLALNGASEDTLDSAFVRGSCYDLTFAYRDGDPDQPAFAAGVALRCAIRMFFTYRGSIFFKMTAGMGDIVFAPAYEVLQNRGVKFRFFHELTEVGLGRDSQGKHIDQLTFVEQAQTRNNKEYQPLVTIDGLPSWPAEPRYEQLKAGAAKITAGTFEHEGAVSGNKKVLKVGSDFDMVVLGISIDSVRKVTAELIADNRLWADMTQRVPTVATQAAQVWLKQNMADLGVDQQPGNLSGFVTPFDTWADMSDLIARESWPQAPQALAYFCSVLPEGDITFEKSEDGDSQDTRANKKVRDNLDNFLGQHVHHLWPGFAYDGNWADAVMENGIYTTANHHGSHRYVQSLPGTVRYRLSPLTKLYDNLTIAGDWTSNGLDAGCVEAAVMSGRLAAHALCGYPALNKIIGFDHP